MKFRYICDIPAILFCPRKFKSNSKNHYSGPIPLIYECINLTIFNLPFFINCVVLKLIFKVKCLYICKKWGGFFKKKKVFLPVLMSFAFRSVLHLLSCRKKQFVRSLGKGTHLTVVAETFSKHLVLYKYNSTKLFSRNHINSLLL